MCYGSSCLRFDPSEGTASARALVRCALQRHGCLRFDPSEGTARSRKPCKHERLVKLPEVRPVRGYCKVVEKGPALAGGAVARCSTRLRVLQGNVPRRHPSTYSHIA